MDTFMDKLAQKLTAQEMIKANTAADTEEMRRLKSQVKEYRDILEQMQRLIEDGSAKLENAKVNGAEINRLVEESIAKINGVQIDIKENEKLQEELGHLEQTLSIKLDEAGESLKQMEQVLSEKSDNVSETVHKECVKVYRNVQAVVVEENGKQTDNIVASVKSLRGKINAVLGISIVAMIAALGGAVFQVLVYLNVV